MISSASSIQRYGGTYGSVNPGTGGQLSSSFEEMMRKAEEDSFARANEAYDLFTERLKASGSKLTEEQKRYLAENFDPKNMTRAEYQAFLDKLCEFGVIDEEDKFYAGYGIPGSNLIPLRLRSRAEVVITPYRENPMHYSKEFYTSKGNVLDWAKYLADTVVWDNKTSSLQKRPEDILFGRIRDALEAISM